MKKFYIGRYAVKKTKLLYLWLWIAFRTQHLKILLFISSGIMKISSRRQASLISITCKFVVQLLNGYTDMGLIQ